MTGGFKNMNADKIIQCILAAMLKLEKTVSNLNDDLQLNKEDKSNKGIANGYAPLDEFTKLAAQYLDIVNDLVTGGATALLSAEQGKVLQTQITAINILLTSDNVNLDTVQELVDAIETLQLSLSAILVNDLTTGGTTKALTAEMGKTLKSIIDSKASIAHTHTVSQITDFPTFKTIENQSIVGAGNIDLNKSDVGLGNVDNTSDLNKPISTATQTALNGKEPIIPTGTALQYIKGDKTLETFPTIPTVDQTIIDGSTNAVSGNAVFDGLKNKLNGSNYPDYVAQNAPTSITGTTYQSFPLMLRSNYGKVLLFYRDGADHAASKGVVKMRISDDGGGNFGSETTIATDAIYDCRNISGGMTSTGRIVLFYMRYNFTASTSFDQGFIYSDDDGSTWSDYQTIPSGTHTFFSPYGEMIPIGNGKLMVCWYGETPATPTYSTYIITSSDNGLTWSSAVAVATSTTLRYGESSYAYLDGGVIVGHVRNSTGSPLYQVISTNNGTTWTNQGVTTVDGGSQVSPMLATFIDPNNQKYIASFYANRSDKKLKVAIAEYATAIAGVGGWTRTDIDSHTSTDFGYPTFIKSRENNKFLIAYYKATSTTLASIYFKNYTPNYGNIAVTGTIASTGNISSSSNISAVSDVLGKDLKGSNTLQVKGVITAFPTAGNGLEAYNSTTTESIIQSYNRILSIFNALNFRGSLLQFFIGATEALRIHASRGVSIGNTTDLGAGTLNVTGNISTIAGTTANHVPIMSQLNLKANSASPALTGTPTAPTAPAGTNTTQIATTAFVQEVASSGSYNPTVTVANNLTSISITNAVYTKIGNIVNCTIGFTCNATVANTNSDFRVSLPFNTVSLAPTYNCIVGSGKNTSIGERPFSIIGQINAQTYASIAFTSTVTINVYVCSVSFQYSIN